MRTNIFIQARMSSTRYPGKMLAPLFGKPLIMHVVDNMRQVSATELVVLISNSLADDPLASYLQNQNIKFFRGNLENVFKRFQEALIVHPCDYFVRICGDSPFINKDLVTYAINRNNEIKSDVLSNVHCLNFPKGERVEIVNSALFRDIDDSKLSDSEKEHVLKYFYNHKSEFKIISVRSKDNLRPDMVNLCVDTIEDLKRHTIKKPIYEFKEEYTWIEKF